MMLKKNMEMLHDYDDVFDLVLAQAKQVQRTETVSLSALSGRVLAEMVCSPIALPTLAISAMDGYGFSTQSSKTLLPIVDTIYAGRVDLSQGISSRKAVKIMTGAVIPEGVDCVVPQERALLQQGDTEPLLIKPDNAIGGQHIKAVGSDIQLGECLLKKGHLIRSQDIALLASVGINKVEVFEEINVVILVSGDELVAPGQPLNPGQIYDANSWLIGDLVKPLPVNLMAVESLPDEPERVNEALKNWGSLADIVITIGGASVGEKDAIKTVLGSLKQSWSWKLNMKPAKPFSMGMLEQAVLLALPGNPLAAFMSFQLFAKAFIQKSAGLLKWQNRSQTLPLAEAYLVNGHKTQWLQVNQTLKGLFPIENGSSSQLSKLVESDGYIRIKPEHTYPKGTLVEFWSY